MIIWRRPYSTKIQIWFFYDFTYLFGPFICFINLLIWIYLTINITYQHILIKYQHNNYQHKFYGRCQNENSLFSKANENNFYTFVGKNTIYSYKFKVSFFTLFSEMYCVAHFCHSFEYMQKQFINIIYNFISIQGLSLILVRVCYHYTVAVCTPLNE